MEVQSNNDISIQLKLLVCCYAMQALSVAAAIFCSLKLYLEVKISQILR